MKDRKNDILEAARDLYNKHGLEQVTMRDVAKKVSISAGNLTYHFPTRNDIVLALMDRLLAEIDKALTLPAFLSQPYNGALAMAVQQCRIVIEKQLEYEFLFNKKYAEIITALPPMQALLQQVLTRRFEQWQQLNTLLVKEKLALASLQADSHAHSHALNIVGLYWHQEAAIYHPQLTVAKKVDYALAVIFQLYKPYLTKKGLAMLNPLLKKLENYAPPAR